MKKSEKIISDLRIGQPDDTFFHHLHQEQIRKINVYLDDCLLRHSPVVKLVIGPFGTGKSTLMKSIFSFYREREIFLSKHVISAGSGIAIREICANMICEALKSMNDFSGEDDGKGIVFEPSGTDNHFVSRYANAWNESDKKNRSDLIGSLFDYMTTGKVLALKQSMGKHYLPISCHKLIDNYLSTGLLLDFYGMFSSSHKNVVLAIDEIEAIGTFYKSKSIDFLDFLRQIVDNSDRFCGVFFFGTTSFLTDLDKYPALYDRLVTPVSSIRSTKWDTQELFPLDGNRVIDAVVDFYQEAYGKFSDPQAIFNALYALTENTSATSPRELIRTVIALLDMSNDSMSSFFRSCRKMYAKNTAGIDDLWEDHSNNADTPTKLSTEQESIEDMDIPIHHPDDLIIEDLLDTSEIEPVSESEIQIVSNDKDTHHLDNVSKQSRYSKKGFIRSLSFFSDLFASYDHPHEKENIHTDKLNDEPLNAPDSNDDFREDFEHEDRFNQLVCEDILEYPMFQKSLCQGAAKSLPWKDAYILKQTTRLHVLASELAFAMDNGFSITIKDAFFDPHLSERNKTALVNRVNVKESSIRLTLDFSCIDAHDARIVDTIQKGNIDRLRIFQILSQIDNRDEMDDIFK